MLRGFRSASSSCRLIDGRLKWRQFCFFHKRNLFRYNYFSTCQANIWSVQKKVNDDGVMRMKWNARMTQQNFLSTTLHSATSLSSKVVPRVKKENESEIKDLIMRNEKKFQAIVRMLGGDEGLAYKMIVGESRFLTFWSEENLKMKIELLNKSGFSNREIVGTYHTLYLSFETLEKRLDRMQSHRAYRYSLGHLIRGKSVFEKMSSIYEKEAQYMEGYDSKEAFLASVLKCTKGEVVKMALDGHLYLNSHLLSSVVNLIKLLQHYGISLEDIRNDPGFLSMRYDNALRRAKILDKYNVTDKRVIRFVMNHTITLYNVAETYARLWRLDTDALGEAKDTKELLCRDLECTMQEVDRMFAVDASLSYTRPHTLKKMIDFLRNELGIPKLWIIQYPLILHFRMDRIKYRYDFLKEVGVNDFETIFRHMFLSKLEFLLKYQDHAHLYTYRS